MKIQKQIYKKETINTKYILEDIGLDIHTVIEQDKIISTFFNMVDLEDDHFIPVLLKEPLEVTVKKLINCKYMEDLFKEIKSIEDVENIKREDIYFKWNGNSLLFDNRKNIISVPYTFDYTCSLTELEKPDDKIFHSLIQKLTNCLYVVDLKTSTIPWYNRDFYGQNGIESCTVLLPQDKYEKIWEQVKYIEFPSCKLHDMISKFRGGEEIWGKEITELSEKYWNIKYPEK